MHLWQTDTAETEQYYARKEIMDCTGENTAENNPQKRRRAELRAHNRPENRPQTRDVQKLDQENAPRFHRNIIHTVLLRICRSGALLIYSKYPFGEPPINKIACNKKEQ